MSRSDANRIALGALRAILDAAKPLELEVAGKKVSVQVERMGQAPWPASQPSRGLSEQSDGPWPRAVLARCTWEGGGRDLKLGVRLSRGSGGSGYCALDIQPSPGPGRITWINVGLRLRDVEDGERRAIDATFSIFKRTVSEDPEVGQRGAEELRELVAESGLPLLTGTKIEAFSVEVPSGAVLPSPEVAFRRVLRLSLYKLNFLSRGEGKGEPLIDVPELLGEELQAELVEESAEEEPEARPPRYWAGGFMWGTTSKLKEFLRGRFWQLGGSRESPTRGEKVAWARFDEIEVGDRFAIKGYGGTHDLMIHFLGTVAAIDEESGRLELEPIEGVPLFHGKAPRGAGAGSWFDPLLSIHRPDVIARIFGEPAGATEEEEQRVPEALLAMPLNLILHGPPGTGKTYRIQKEILPLFVHEASGAGPKEPIPDLVAPLAWYQVVALALEELGGEATVDQLMEQPLIKAKQAQRSSFRAPLRSYLWNALQTHAVAYSETVRLERRVGELLFDKRPDGTWFFPQGLSEDLEAFAEQLRPRAAPERAAREDYDFLSFHQSYSYEDFIEGIRPKVEEEEEGGSLRYVLEAGVLKRAVLAAIRLAGFEGSIHELCSLPAEERRSLFDGAPRYALFIDEISRGNVAQIFGELISLIEEDKRLGAPNELILTLPYSRSRFGVPSNLHLIATMNTADRSVEALDVALRRRFAFEEMPPRPSLLDFFIEGKIDPRRMLVAINERLRVLRDEDHLIGHAYFTALSQRPTLEALKEVFERAILPLLKEYFFGDWGRIGLVLGRDFVRPRSARAGLFADFDHEALEALEDRPSYELTDIASLTSVSFRRIYEDVPEDA